MARSGCDFQSLTLENRDWKEAEAMSREIIQFDDAMFETKLDAMVRDKVEQIVNAMPDASGRRDRQRRGIRTNRRTQGVPCRPLRTRPDRQGRQAGAEGAETGGRGLRVGGDRTIPAARAGHRGIIDRHVPGGREHPAGGRHRPAVVGRSHALADALRQVQALLWGDGPVAQQAVGGRMAVRVRGRRVAQAIMGRASGERERARRHRHRHGWSP